MTHAPFTVGTITAEPGRTATGYARVDVGEQTLSLPIAIVHGAQSGPVLAVTAGIHGGEYVSMLAVRRFIRSLDPTSMTGTVVASLQSSPAAFRERIAFVNPLDGENLNRSFPGDPQGGPTERLAHWLWQNVVSRGDAYIDCHCGDLPESLAPFTGVVITGDREAEDRAFAIADRFPVPLTLTSTTAGSTFAAAAAAGIPAVLVEIGDRGLWTEEQVQQQLEGLLAAAAHLGITPGTSGDDPAPHPVFEGAASIISEHEGLWFPALRPGDPVAAGGTIGVVEDAFGDTIATITSPVGAVYLYGLTSLAIRVGDFVAALIRPARR